MNTVSRLTAGIRTMWRELGNFGKVTLVGLTASFAIAIMLGFGIPALVRDNLLQARVETFVAVTEDLAGSKVIPVSDPTPGELAALDEHIRLRLLGGDAVRVKLWRSDNTIVYSDAASLQGRQFPVSEDRRRAFSGDVIIGRPDLTLPENATERDYGDLVEFYVPVPTESGETDFVFELYQDASSMNATVASTQRTVWLSIAIGLTVLAAFMGSLMIANARFMTRRAEQAERLVSELAGAQDDERRRVVGALHDDIGQPLYRVLYGIQGSRSQLEPGPVADELARLEDLLRNIDATLRTELRFVHHGSVEHLDLDTLVAELAGKVETETDLNVDLRLEDHAALSVPMRAALYGAAREALTNVRKHSGAGSISITLRDGNRRVLLEVEDDGHGLAGAPGLGLTTSRERLEAIGGGLDVVARNGAGTLFRAWVPVGERRMS